MRSTALIVLLFAACTSEAGGGPGDYIEALEDSEEPGAALGSPGTPEAAQVTTWNNTAIPGQTGLFHVVLAAVPEEPAGAAVDAGVGLSSGAAARFSHMAAIVRFSPAGVLDVRNGSTYEADAAFPYRAGTTYQIWFDVDLVQRRYSVLVQENGGQTTKIAHRYAFRTEQAALSKIDNLAVFVDSPTGSLRTYGAETGN